jgi:hypothetical protein
MAIAINSRVALKNLGASPLVIGQMTAQPVLFGTSETAGGGALVIDWDNGAQATIPAGNLDEIFAASPTTQLFLGRVVNVSAVAQPGQSASYAGIVIAVYNRDNAQECVLVKTNQNGAYFELDAANVVIVAGS